MSDVLKRIATRFDVGLLATFVLCLFALLPLTTQGGIVHGHDTLLHAHRMAEMQRSWAHGLLMPTWAETFYYGYGSPVFHYYSPLAYYFGAASVTLGFDVVSAIRLLIALMLLAAGIGTYLFAKEHFGAAGGVLSALCYVYSPYLLYTEPYTRGDYPELLAFAVFPFVMWRFERLLRHGLAQDVLFAALSIVPLILAHNLMAVALFALLVGWLAWRAVVRAITLRRFALAIAAAALGVGLMTTFWLPVGLERDVVQIDNVELITQDRRRDFFEFFIPATRLFAFNTRTDEGAVNGIQMHLNIGVAQWALAISGLVAVFVGVQRAALLPMPFAKRQFTFFALAAVAMIVLMLPVAYPIWTNFAPLNYMVFPWRFLGPLAFCLAILAGANVLWLKRLPLRLAPVLYSAFLLLPLASALSLLHMPQRYTAPLETDVNTYLRGEIDGSISLGTTAYNEFLPATVFVLPPVSERLVEEFAQGYPVDPANRDLLPDGVELNLTEHHPERSVWQVSAGTDFTLEVLTFYFPGWYAEVDGQPVTITPSDQYGLITFPVPQGEHTITLSLGSTPTRDAAAGISVAAGLAMVIFSVYLWRQQKMVVAERVPLPDEIFYGWRWGLVATAVAQVIVVALFLREGVAWLNSPLGQAYPAQQQTQYQLGDQMRLLGYDLSSTQARAGDQIEIVLYWYAEQPPTYNYSSFVHVSNGGPPLAQLDKSRVADRPSAAWTADGYLIDSYIVPLPETMPAGEYQIIVGVYTCESLPAGECGNGDRLQVIDAEGETVGDSLILGTLTVR